MFFFFIDCFFVILSFSSCTWDINTKCFIIFIVVNFLTILNKRNEKIRKEYNCNISVNFIIWMLEFKNKSNLNWPNMGKKSMCFQYSLCLYLAIDWSSFLWNASGSGSMQHASQLHGSHLWFSIPCEVYVYWRQCEGPSKWIVVLTRNSTLE